MAEGGKVLALFDVDGTLTAPRKVVTEEMTAFMLELRKHVNIGIVGGSDLTKIKEQLGEDCISRFDWTFGQNGLEAFKGDEKIGETSIRTHFDDGQLKELINFALHYFADLDIPVKRGTFVEFRSGMLNMSPIGRNCSQEERDAFEEYDKEAKVRETMVGIMREKFAHMDLTFSIGGQISFDVFPRGWDKTFCLQYVTEYDTVHFFGDKTYEGGNDFEIFSAERTVGHTVTSPEDTRQQCTELFLPS